MSENSVPVSTRRNAKAEAFNVLQVQPPGLLHDNYSSKLKIHSGAMGNTLPLRTFKLMYGKRANCDELLTGLSGVKLTAYNGQKIFKEWTTIK